MAAESLYVPDWRAAARRDWDRVTRLLALEDVEGAAFFLQQALEKYLKAYLPGRGWKLRKIHLLHALLDDAMRMKVAWVYSGVCLSVWRVTTSPSGIPNWFRRASNYPIFRGIVMKVDGSLQPCFPMRFWSNKRTGDS